MILTCPECATSYFVEDGKIPPGGRTVRCAACGARWMATPEPLADPAPEPPPPPPEPSAEPLEAQDHPQPIIDVAGGELAKSFRARAREQQTARQGPPAAAVWTGALVAVLLVLGGGILMRNQVVGLWPGAAGTYARIGLPVNAVGLEFEGVKLERGLKGGRDVLIVSGQIRNPDTRNRTSPPLRFSVMDQAHKVLAVKLATPENPAIPAGKARHFAVNLEDPPAGWKSVDVRFALKGDEAARAEAAKPPPPPAPEPVVPEAQPLDPSEIPAGPNG